jgi:hypothetical protein
LILWNTVKPAHEVTCIKRSPFSCPFMTLEHGIAVKFYKRSYCYSWIVINIIFNEFIVVLTWPFTHKLFLNAAILEGGWNWQTQFRKRTTQVSTLPKTTNILIYL